MGKPRTTKPVHSFRLSAEGLRQIRDLSQHAQRSEANIVEIAVDRMHREEIRFGRLSVRETRNNMEEQEGTHEIHRISL